MNRISKGHSIVFSGCIALTVALPYTMDTSSQMSEHEGWVKVDEQLDNPFSFKQIELAEKAWKERSALIIAAWSLLLYRGSACCNEDETFAFSFKGVERDSPDPEVRVVKIEQVVRSRTDPISQVLHTAEAIVEETTDSEVGERVESAGLLVSNNAPDEEVRSCHLPQ